MRNDRDPQLRASPQLHERTSVSSGRCHAATSETADVAAERMKGVLGTLARPVADDGASRGNSRR